MRKLLAIALVMGGLSACGSTDSTQEIRDNETPVSTQDEVDNRQITPDTLVIDTTAIN